MGGSVSPSIDCGAAPNYFLSEATWEALAASDREELIGALRDDRLVAVAFFGSRASLENKRPRSAGPLSIAGAGFEPATSGL